MFQGVNGGGPLVARDGGVQAVGGGKAVDFTFFGVFVLAVFFAFFVG